MKFGATRDPIYVYIYVYLGVYLYVNTYIYVCVLFKLIVFFSQRRAAQYEVRRYPQHLSVATEYERRADGFSTLGAYTGGANEDSKELKPFVSYL